MGWGRRAPPAHPIGELVEQCSRHGIRRRGYQDAPAEVGAIENRRIRARFETPAGKLSVYVDTTPVVGSFIIDQWRYLGRPGRIGLWLRYGGAGAEMDTFDDFGRG